MTSFDNPANDNVANRKLRGERIAVPFGIDLSAWISGASFALGVILAGPSSLFENLAQTSLILSCYVAFILVVLAIQHHMRIKATATTFGKPAKLVTSGIFRVSRNPIYLAFLLPLASISILSVPAALIAMVVYVCAMSLAVIPREEQSLSQIFGQDFTAYMETTRRWI